MDFTGVFRNHNAGGGIGSNFGAIPYELPTAPTVEWSPHTSLNHVNEARLSMQNSRLGFRVDALVKGAHVIGYMEADFLGNNPRQNVAVSSNSNTLRSRLYWVDVAKGKWEFLGGQTWSLITPGRTGISPLPGNIFYSQDTDVNYQAGLVWGRIPEFRFVFHPHRTRQPSRSPWTIRNSTGAALRGGRDSPSSNRGRSPVTRRSGRIARHAAKQRRHHTERPRRSFPIDRQDRSRSVA